MTIFFFSFSLPMTIFFSHLGCAEAAIHLGTVCHCVANNIFYFKENRRKLRGHKIASLTHKIPALPLGALKRLEGSM